MFVVFRLLQHGDCFRRQLNAVFLGSLSKFLNLLDIIKSEVLII